MNASLKLSPSPPALPKTEGRSRSPSKPLSSPAGVDTRAVELPELKERVPLTDQSKMQLVPLHNYLIPEELLATLASTVCPHDRLGPPSLSKTPKDFKVHGIRHTDAVWHHPVGRKKYKYFIDQPTSLTGAGRDISFLCDAMVSKRERIPLPPMPDRGAPHTQGIQKDTSLMESLIPEEYHIVKTRGVQGLECYDDKSSVLLEDDEKMLKVFPSMRPSGRQEAVQLMKVMDEMLDKAGVNNTTEDRELSELSQMQGLLELVRVEQNICNVVFHELVRQVSVECAERGQLLAKLRRTYAALLDRIPRWLKGLHTETLAQRALDRRLTEETICFKSSITQLSTELSEMREQDEYVSQQAEGAQVELAKALEQSQLNSDMVGEYHDLYEMQRRRLEGQVERLTDERDLWSKVTFSLTLKVIKLNNLKLASRLHVSEQTWTKTAEHFTFILTSKDSEDLSRVMQLTDQWKDRLTVFMQRLGEAERATQEEIRVVQAGVVKWHAFCGSNIKSPHPQFEKVSEEQLFTDLKQWSNVLTKECERYGGADLLSCQQTLIKLGGLQEAWVEVGLQLFRRHPEPGGAPPRGQEAMRDLGHVVSELHTQLGTRIHGESGIQKQLMSLAGAMELWATKLKALIGRTETLPYSDWLKLEKALGGWMKLSEEALQHVHGTQPENERVKQKPHVKIEIDDVFNSLQEFIATQTNFFDCENLRLCEEVNSLHTALTHWMAALLPAMVPDHGEDQQEPTAPPDPGDTEDVSLDKLGEDARNLAQKLEYFSKYITSSCQTIVEEEMQRSVAQDDTVNKLYELHKLQRECADWVDACQILLSDMRGSPVELRVTMNTVPTVPHILPSAVTSLQALGTTVISQEVLEKEEVEAEAQVPWPEISQSGETEGLEEAMGGDPQGGSTLMLIGPDGNIIERTLGEETIQLDGTEEMVVSPDTDGAHKSFDALATVGVLQAELLGVEVRAQSSEVRALKAEEALQAALEKIQDLERQLQDRPSLEVKVSKSKKSVVAPKKVATPEPKVLSQKPESSPKQSNKPKKR